MTPRKPLADLPRPHRAFGRMVATVMNCPLCSEPGPGSGGDLRVVAYRQRTVRIECRHCRLRFSVDVLTLYAALVKHTDHLVGSSSEEFEGLRRGFKTLGVEVLESHLRANGTWEELEATLAARGET